MKRILKLLAFPILAFLWMVGWICYVVGERKEFLFSGGEETSFKEASLDYPALAPARADVEAQTMEKQKGRIEKRTKPSYAPPQSFSSCSPRPSLVQHLGSGLALDKADPRASCQPSSTWVQVREVLTRPFQHVTGLALDKADPRTSGLHKSS